MKMFKKDGKVAVLVSPGFGAGFSTWNSPEMAVDFDLVEAFLKDDISRFEYVLNEKYNESDGLFLKPVLHHSTLSGLKKDKGFELMNMMAVNTLKY